MALPWLESANVWGDEPKKNRPASEAPVRVAALFSGNGFHSKEWWAKGEGKDMELGQVLAPLNDFRSKLLFVKGLYHEEARKGNIHSSQTGNLGPRRAQELLHALQLAHLVELADDPDPVGNLSRAGFRPSL